MRQELIAEFERRARQANSTDEYDEVLAEAKALLSLEEYTTLLGWLQQPAETREIEASNPDQSP